MTLISARVEKSGGLSGEEMAGYRYCNACSPTTNWHWHPQSCLNLSPLTALEPSVWL